LMYPMTFFAIALYSCECMRLHAVRLRGSSR
jgi:uncharacterized OsmC-like protein